ncbi:MAG: hypothetical protein PVI71_09465 [Desulfobacterales bacterium]|jgi:hypothetical protein
MKLQRIFKICVVLICLSSFLAACQNRILKDALMLSPASLKDRQLQTRIFEAIDEKKLLTASAAVLQDLGYTIDETEVRAGVIVCSRDRDVTDPGEVLLSIALLLLGLYVPYAEKQKVLASLVTQPLQDESIAVRITFQHMVWNSDNVMIKNEQINEPEIYQDFFSKLSKSVFLVAHEI